MIWSMGRVVEDSSIAFDAGDRMLEHGVGLFETLRTWDGKTPTLERHLARMSRSAAELGVPIDSKSFPDSKAVLELREFSGHGGDVVVRITASGGLAETKRSARLWMRSRQIPSPDRILKKLVVAEPRVCWHDPLARHKTLNYWLRKRVYDEARARDADDAVFLGYDGRMWETSRANIFIVKGREIITPSIEGPIVPGVMRGLVIELARSAKRVVREVDCSLFDLDNADEAFLTNSVGGVMPIAHAPGRALPAPGPATAEVHSLVTRYLKN